MTKKYAGFEITKKEIDSTLRYLKHQKGKKDATREDAVALLEDFNALAHMMAHKLVGDERSGKIKPVRIKKTFKKK